MDLCVTNGSVARQHEGRYDRTATGDEWTLHWQESGNVEILSDSERPVLAIGTVFGPLRSSEGLINGDPATLGQDALGSNGSFAVFIPKDSGGVFVTDAGASIPIYWGSGPKGVAAGTLVHHVAHASGQTNLDLVSAVDLLMNEMICYPYTLFENVRILPPGSVCTLSQDGVDIHTYWEPEEPSDICTSGDEEAWGRRLNNEMRKSIEASTRGADHCRVLFSGGQDSRAVASLLPDDVPTTLTTVLDGKNSEYRQARRAAWGLGYPLEWIERPDRYYRENVAARIDRVGPGVDIRHTHIYGPVEDRFQDSDVILGGFLADTFFKTYFMSNVAWPSGRPRHLLPPDPDQIGVPLFEDGEEWFDSEIVAEARGRRREHHEKLKDLRPKTAGNWHALWPGSQHPYYAHYLSCLRIGPRMVEPFAYHQMYQLAARMPDPCRVNGRAFRRAFSKEMGLAGWMPAGASIPRLGKWGDQMFASVYVRLKKVRRILNLAGGQNGGPWSPDHGGWYPVDLTEHFGGEAAARMRSNLQSLLASDRDFSDFMKTRDLPNDIRVRALSLATGT